MSSTTIPNKVVLQLWTSAGGRCEYDGCNRPLWYDGLTFAKVNRAFLAHIVADMPGGPRGDPVRSPLLAKAIENLMLLCSECHRRIDIDDVAGHPEERLLLMKAEHEKRIERVTGIGPDRQTHVVVFRAPIGADRMPAERKAMRDAVIAAGRYPLPEELVVDLAQVPTSERSEHFWTSTREQLREHVANRVQWALTQSSVQHVSVFGLAPIPLLIAFGKLLGDKIPMDVYQRHRSTEGWTWPVSDTLLEFHLDEPTLATRAGDVALVLSISDSVQYPDVQAAVPAGTPIYEIRIKDPRRDCVRSHEDVQAFAFTWQRTLEIIRARHRDEAPRIHVFAAIPNSLAIECGRRLLPKTHSPLFIYDFNRELDGFRLAFEL